MTVNVVQLLVALVLLWCPRQFLRLGVRVGPLRRRPKRQASDRGPYDAGVSLRHELGKLRNYIDFGRGALGSAVVFGTDYTSACIEAVAGAPAGSGRIVLVAKILILVIALAIQLVRLEPRLKLFAPIFFLSGVSFGLCGIKVAGFAIVMIWAINLATLPPSGFLFLHGVVLMAFGSLFNGSRLLSTANRQTLIAAFLLAAPALVSWMAREQLVHFIKRAKTAEELSQAS